jgi:DNA-binding Lrp family transcriptional regulator
MTSSQLPGDVARFLERHVDSIEHLEVLLLLFASGERSWTAEEIATHLRVQPESVRRRLGRLEADGLVVADAPPSAFRAAPNPALVACVRHVAQVYKERRVSVITFIFSRPTRDVYVLADAFKIKKDR